ncbi:MAG: hypothetical protein VX583_05525 [Bdellovibrionota bacterium]
MLGNAISEQPLASIDQTLAVASGFGGTTAALGVSALTSAGVSNIGIEAGVAALSDLLFITPVNNMSPGPYGFGRMCK